jgi:predicted ATPase
MPHFLALLAEAYEHAGQPTNPLTELDEAMVWAEATGEAMYHAELHRLKGQLLLQPSLDPVVHEIPHNGFGSSV